MDDFENKIKIKLLVYRNKCSIEILCWARSVTFNSKTQIFAILEGHLVITK